MASPRPGWRIAVGLAVFAALVRLGVIALTLALAAGPTGDGPSLVDVSDRHDGAEYRLVASSLGSAEAMAVLPDISRRLGPGYPLLVKAASVLVAPEVAGLALAVLSSALATALVYLLGVPLRGAALFAVLTPSWVANTSASMSEGPFLVLALLGLLAWKRVEGRRAAAEPGRVRGSWATFALEVATGLAFGYAALVRPVGAVLFAALWLLRLASPSPAGVGRPRGLGGAAPGPAPAPLRSRPRPLPEAVPVLGLRERFRSGFATAVGPLLGFAIPGTAWLLSSVAVPGPADQVGTYLRSDLAPPLSSLWAGFAAPLADPLMTAHNLAVLVLTGMAAALLVRRWNRSEARAEAAEEALGEDGTLEAARGDGVAAGSIRAPSTPAVPPREWLVWLGSQALFYVFLPSSWVFACLPRFLVPVLPAVAFALDPHLPRRRGAFALLLGGTALLSVAVSLYWNLRGLGIG